MVPFVSTALQLVFVVVVVDSDSDGGEFPLMFRSDAAIIMLV